MAANSGRYTQGLSRHQFHDGTKIIDQIRGPRLTDPAFNAGVFSINWGVCGQPRLPRVAL